ncbi:hypothetical protein INR49_030648 [Caranx melampygus]|nr:hypothetical protein INR49_030648 [Caranx melampygus]
MNKDRVKVSSIHRSEQTGTRDPSHRTRGRRCQGLSEELQSCYCCDERNLEQTNDKGENFQKILWSFCG